MVLSRLRLLGRFGLRPAAWVIVGALLVGGCGSGAKLVPVAGTVTLDGQPLPVGSVTFQPEAGPGNANQEVPVGKIVDGKYELTTHGKKGAPPGKYKVVVVSNNFSGDNPPKPTGGSMPVPKSFISLKYSTAAATPLSKEVVANPVPDAYDLKLTK